MEYNKLVRDKVPGEIEKEGKIPVIHTAGYVEYYKRLVDKLQEEVAEYAASGKLEELADLLEVIYAICKLKRVKRDDLETIRKEKAKTKGGFNNRVILEEVINKG